MSFSMRLSAQDIRTLDTQAMAGHISKMGTHLREAVSFAEEALSAATLPEAATVRSIVVIGIGGSAIGGDLVRSYLTGSLSVPVYVSRGYDLPSFVTSETLIVVSSYSGNTEESLSQFEQAISLVEAGSVAKTNVVCMTTGGTLGARAKELGLTVIAQRPGMQPRAALAYSFAPILLLIEKIGLVKNEKEKLLGTAALLDHLAEEYGTTALSAGGGNGQASLGLENNPAFALATQLLHRVPVIYSASDVMEAVNLRWRGQLQENAKHLAFGNVLPEMNHNEINGWSHPTDLLSHFTVLLLRSREDEHERVAKRFAVTSEMLSSKGMGLVTLEARGAHRLERMFSLISLADWVSFYLAMLSGTDPTPIPAIDHLKARMG